MLPIAGRVIGTVERCLMGLYISYRTDLPMGPTVVCAFAIALLLAFILHKALHLPATESEPV